MKFGAFIHKTLSILQGSWQEAMHDKSTRSLVGSQVQDLQIMTSSQQSTSHFVALPSSWSKKNIQFLCQNFLWLPKPFRAVAPPRRWSETPHTWNKRSWRQEKTKSGWQKTREIRHTEKSPWANVAAAASSWSKLVGALVEDRLTFHKVHAHRLSGTHPGSEMSLFQKSVGTLGRILGVLKVRGGAKFIQFSIKSTILGSRVIPKCPILKHTHVTRVHVLLLQAAMLSKRLV